MISLLLTLAAANVACTVALILAIRRLAKAEVELRALMMDIIQRESMWHGYDQSTN